ncbi:MAG: hypothetical protein E6356_17085 [Terrisporobacter othiniensis]|nr:hypothetical protein [Terrisporobacter othiniensis]MDU6996573.1 hypothetical protein [Terrisporobacter othiniensis]
MRVSEDIMSIINAILECEDIREAVELYNRYSNDLKNCKFITFSDEYGQELPEYMINNDLEGFKINSLTSYKKMFVIDEDTCNQMIKTNRANYFIDPCIALDTQAVSYLTDLFNDKELEINNKDKPIIDYIMKNEIDYDCSLYMWENSGKLNSIEEIEATYSNLLAIEHFKSLNKEAYIVRGEVQYDKTDSEIYISADSMIADMKKISNNPDLEEFNRLYDVIKLIILKSAIIEFKYSKKGIRYKIELLMDFVNNQLGYILEREIAICYLFLAHDKRVEKFLKKIKSNCYDIIKHINGMAWDLNHIRYIEYTMANYKPKKSIYEIYTLYSIITFDYGLQEVLKTYPIKRCAIYDGTFLPVFEVPLHEFIKEIKDFKNSIYLKKETRENIRKTADYKLLIKNLENDLESLLK